MIEGPQDEKLGWPAPEELRRDYQTAVHASELLEEGYTPSYPLTREQLEELKDRAREEAYALLVQAQYLGVEL